MKAVFVIDVPNELDVNNLLIDYCVHTKGEYKTIRKGGNHPLKTLPQKIEGKREKFMPTYSLGWNDCLDAVELGLKPLWEKTE